MDGVITSEGVGTASQSFGKAAQRPVQLSPFDRDRPDSIESRKASLQIYASSNNRAFEESVLPIAFRSRLEPETAWFLGSPLFTLPILPMDHSANDWPVGISTCKYLLILSITSH